MKILMIEDDEDLRVLLSTHLRSEGYEVIEASDGLEGLKLFNLEQPNLVLLDYMMPKLNGFQVLARLREVSQIPVLMLSAKDQDVDKALGLEIGADDYLGKPCSLIELTARVKALLRRSEMRQDVNVQGAGTDQFLSLNGLTLDLHNYQVHVTDKSVSLTAKEYGLLKLLMKHPNRIFTKAQIYQSVWEDTYYGDDNAINVHMRRLREKIELDPSNPCYIKTVWGIGYKFEVSREVK